MSVSRRKFLRVLGIGGVVCGTIAAAGYAAVSVDGMPASAIAAWAGPDPGEADIRIRTLSHAILAPNPHNRQPWLVDLSVADEITLYCDRTRLLPHTDPFGRQIMIGHGTFLELLALAARAEGYRADIRLFPDGGFPGTEIGDTPVARIRLVRDPALRPDPLFAHIFDRRSNKEPFDTGRWLNDSDADALAEAYDDPAIPLSVTTDRDLTERLRGIAGEASRIEMVTPRTHKESIDLMRIGAAEIAADPDGIDLQGPMIWWGRKLGFISREAMLDPTTSAFATGAAMVGEQSGTAMGWAWMTTADNSRETQIATGRAYVRLNLQATALGVAFHPMSQVLQEYPEMRELQAVFRETIGTPAGATVQMLIRLGYGTPPGPSPRRRLDDLILT